MFNFYQNITEIFLLQHAIGSILEQIVMETDAHAASVITDNSVESIIDSLNLSEIPTIRTDCRIHDNDFTNFINQVQQSISIGSSFFVVSEACALPFLDHFREIHDWVEQKYEKKVLVVIDTQNLLTRGGIMDILSHTIVINDLPLTLVLKPNTNNDWIDIWSAFPYRSYFEIHNRFILSNSSLQFVDKSMIPEINNLNGLPFTGAFMNYPPYTGYKRVPPGTGNAHLFGSNATLEIELDGQEHIILIEFCVKYNCTLTARLEYDEEFWGESFPNHTGYGLVGAVAVRDAHVTCAAMYLWDNTYEFTQYTAMIQQATATNVVPKPLPLPYWQTPILPFPGYIWRYIFGAFLIVAVTVFIMNAIQRNINVDEHREDYIAYGLFDSIYAMVKIYTSQSVSISISFFSNIIIFTALLMFALVIDNLYCGGLASVMTITRYEKPVDSLEALVESKFLWGQTSTAWLFSYLQSDYPPHQKYVAKFIVKPLPELYKLVQQQKIAVAGETMQHGTLSYQSYIDRESSKYYMIMKNPMSRQATIFMTSKTWPFMEQLNRIVLMQQESGIRYYWEHSAAVRTTDYTIQRTIEENGKPPDQDGEPVKLSIQHVTGALFMLMFGYVFSVISFLLELLWSRNKEHLSKLTYIAPYIIVTRILHVNNNK